MRKRTLPLQDLVCAPQDSDRSAALFYKKLLIDDSPKPSYGIYRANAFHLHSDRRTLSSVLAKIEKVKNSQIRKMNNDVANLHYSLIEHDSAYAIKPKGRRLELGSGFYKFFRPEVLYTKSGIGHFIWSQARKNFYERNEELGIISSILYHLFCSDEFGVSVPEIIDFSAHPTDKTRKAIIYSLDDLPFYHEERLEEFLAFCGRGLALAFEMIESSDGDRDRDSDNPRPQL